eukprot:CAMPEP_0118846522 /NCGR_PEP_ID=MMETSP1162-20130426/92504_1 /TAXON_ID=33656 /ORGANISM="Phaeocystis Sp, Strain CCMP2710" /LENGTH=361 /DNA_ID=CAMNT_0006778703 /DNA_START=150 /DNA_END=1236 /DNA_ORIENTATION=-
MPGGVHEFMKAWEPEEDQIIMEMLERLGPKWSKIVQRLPGRTVSSVRNRWQRIDKGRRLREAGHESKNRCQQCGKPKRGHVCMARLKNRGESGELAAMALKQWEVANHVVTGGPVKGGEGGETVPLVSRSMSAPAYLEGNGERPVGRDYDKGQASMENAALLSQLSSGMTSGFAALAAAAESELKRTNFATSSGPPPAQPPAAPFAALAAAAESELKRTNSCDLQRTASCSASCGTSVSTLGDARAMSNHQVSNPSVSTSAALPLSSSSVHTALFSFGPGPANVRGESSSSSGSQDSSTTSDTASMPSVADEMDHKLKATEQKQRLADLVAADQRIFSGDEGCEEEEAARIEAESDAAQVA